MLAVALSLLALLGTPARGSESDDLSKLRTLEGTVASGFSNKNLDELMSVYAPGDSLFVFDVVGPPGTYRSWEGYRNALEHLFASFQGPLHFSISDLDIKASGDVAYGRSLQHVAGVRAKDGTPLDYTVHVTDVYRKIGGKWLIVQEHVSLPLERTTFKPMLHTSIP